MMKRKALFIAVACICAVLAVYALMCVAQDKSAKPAQGKKFIPSPVFSPPYPPLPHHFSDLKTIQILCQAPKGAIKRALMQPLEPAGEGDLFRGESAAGAEGAPREQRTVRGRETVSGGMGSAPSLCGNLGAS